MGLQQPPSENMFRKMLQRTRVEIMYRTLVELNELEAHTLLTINKSKQQTNKQIVFRSWYKDNDSYLIHAFFFK